MRAALVLALLCIAAPLHAQYGPPVYAGAGVTYGSFPHLFVPSCSAPNGGRLLGPDIWAGLRLGQARIVARAALVSDPHRGEGNCYTEQPQNATVVSRNYDALPKNATMYDARALYTRSFRVWHVAGGLHAGRISENRSNYYGASVMVRYGSLGLGTDYSRHKVSYEAVEKTYRNGLPSTQTIVGGGEETVNALFFKLFVEMTR